MRFKKRCRGKRFSRKTIWFSRINWNVDHIHFAYQMRRVCTSFITKCPHHCMTFDYKMPFRLHIVKWAEFLGKKEPRYRHLIVNWTKEGVKMCVTVVGKTVHVHSTRNDDIRSDNVAFTISTAYGNNVNCSAFNMQYNEPCWCPLGTKGTIAGCHCCWQSPFDW